MHYENAKNFEEMKVLIHFLIFEGKTSFMNTLIVLLLNYVDTNT